MADQERSAREDSGLQDILSVTNKLKDRDGLSAVDGEPEQAGDSGMIVFGSKDLDSATESDDSGLMVSFAGGLGAVAPVAASDPDLTPLAGSGSVREARPVEPAARPVEEPKRNPLVAIAVVLGLCLAGAAAVVLSQKGDPKPQQAQNEPEVSANQDVPATVAAQAEPAPEAAPTSAGAAPPVEPVIEPPLEGETAGPVDTDGALLAMGEGDPLAQTDGLLNPDGTKKTTTPASYGGGVRTKPSSTGSGGVVDEEPQPEPEPEPEPVVDPLPKKSGSTTDQASQDEVDCLLNPDLPKCLSGSKSSGKDGPVLVPKVPEKLDSTMLKTGFNTVKSKAKACGSKFGAAAGTKVKIHASIEGASGKITSVEATGEHAGTELGKCVEDAVKDATFEVFKSPAQGVDYSIVM
jgi:hypothetical protein